MVRKSEHVHRTINDQYRVEFYGYHVGTFPTSREAHAALKSYLNSMRKAEEANRRNPDKSKKG